MLKEICEIMLKQQIVQRYDEFLDITEGDKIAAAILTLINFMYFDTELERSNMDEK